MPPTPDFGGRAGGRGELRRRRVAGCSVDRAGGGPLGALWTQGSPTGYQKELFWGHFWRLVAFEK